MVYEKLTYTNERGESIEFSTDSIFHCNVSKDVDGIAGVTNTIYSTNSMGQHGDTYVGQRIEARDIDIAGHINTTDKQQAYSLRRQLLKVLNPELQGTLTYEYGSFKRMITCRLHGKPEVARKSILQEFNIQLDCLNPFWREEAEEKEDIASWVAAWHFPCVIEKENPKSMVFGYRAESVIVDCYNEGDVSTGMRVRFTALGTVVNPVILNVDTEEFIKLNVTMQTGDVVEINTKYGSKGATLIRDEVKYDYFRYVDVDSTFMQLAIGDNNFRYDAEGGVDAMEVSIFYNKEYLGGIGMELKVFDKTLEPLGIVDEMDTLLWGTKYFDVGTFNLLAPITDNNKRLLVEGNLVIKHDGKQEITDASGGIWRRAAQITYIHVTKDMDGLEQIEAQGYMLGWWLNRRCICPRITASDTNQNIINLLVRNNCGSGAGTKRRFPGFIMLEQETIAGSTVEYANEAYAKLGTEVKARAQAGKLGYDILLNERTRQYGFYLYKGNDLTARNNEGNTPCIFSRDFDNVNEQEYTASIENCGNFIYVQGAADDDGSQPVTTVDGEGASGLELVEVFHDAADIARKYKEGGTEVTIPLNTYMQMLKTRGGAELEYYGKTVNFTSTINTNSNLKFKQDFDLGDRITCKETAWGIQIDARITEVLETYRKGAEEIEATFGESLPTLADQIRKVR